MKDCTGYGRDALLKKAADVHRRGVDDAIRWPYPACPWNLFDRGQQALAILKHDLVELGPILFFDRAG
jgi:hypothetical protein